MTFIMYPGNLVCDLAGFKAETDHRQLLRMFANTFFWSLVGVTAVLFLV